MPEHYTIELAAIIVFGIGAQWIAWRFNLPSILILLLTGIVIGPILDILHPDELLGDILLPFVSISVAVILFEGGMSLKFAELREVGKVVRNLVTIGALITWALSAIAAKWILGLETSLAILLGGILVVTGPTVIIPMLHYIRPLPRLSSALRWEGILIDPIGALLAVLIYEVIVLSDAETVPAVILFGVLKTILVGGTLGLAAAGMLYFILLRYWVPDHLRNPLALTFVIATHVASNHLQSESGLLAVTIMGIALANQKKVTMQHIIDFKEDLSILLISSLFILLAARINVRELTEVLGISLPFLLVSILLIRPLSVAVSTIGSDFNWRERLFLGCMAPRGIVAAAVSSIFSLRLAQAGYEQGEMLVPYTFITIVGTVLIYGLVADFLAKKLRISQANPQGTLIVGAHSWAREIARNLQNEGLNVLLVDTNRRNVTHARLEGLPAQYGNIFSDYILLDGIGKLLALTSNDECNALATVTFSDYFGTANVFQLTPESGEKDKKAGFTPAHLRGRFLFSKDVTYRYLDERFTYGASLKKTQLTDEFTFQHFKERYGEDSLPLFLITENKQLKIFNEDHPPQPQPGNTIISLISGEKSEEQAQQHQQKKKLKKETREESKLT